MAWTDPNYVAGGYYPMIPPYSSTRPMASTGGGTAITSAGAQKVAIRFRVRNQNRATAIYNRIRIPVGNLTVGTGSPILKVELRSVQAAALPPDETGPGLLGFGTIATASLTANVMNEITLDAPVSLTHGQEIYAMVFLSTDGTGASVGITGLFANLGFAYGNLLYSAAAWATVFIGSTGPNVELLTATDIIASPISGAVDAFGTFTVNSGGAITRVAQAITLDVDRMIDGARFALGGAAATGKYVLRDSAGVLISEVSFNMANGALGTSNSVDVIWPTQRLGRRGETYLLCVEPDATSITAYYYSLTAPEILTHHGKGNIGMTTFDGASWSAVDNTKRTFFHLLTSQMFIPPKGKGMSKMDFVNPLATTDFPTETASFTGTAGSTDPWAAGPEGVLVWADQDCYVAVGEEAVATANHTPIPAYTPIPFKVPQGTGAPWRVSALQISTGGTVYAKPINAK